MKKTIFQCVTACLFAVASMHGYSAETVGKVISTAGSVSAVTAAGEKRSLKRRSRVFEGDTIVTGKTGKAQVRFVDGALVQVESGSEFRVDEYRYNGTQDGSESAVMTLIKGGMRTVTGAVGKTNHERYQMKTRVATIGIRGTDYMARDCEGSTIDLCAQICGAGTDFVAGVDYGAIQMNTADKSFGLKKGQSACFKPGEQVPDVITASIQNTYVPPVSDKTAQPTFEQGEQLELTSPVPVVTPPATPPVAPAPPPPVAVRPPDVPPEPVVTPAPTTNTPPSGGGPVGGLIGGGGGGGTVIQGD